MISSERTSHLWKSGIPSSTGNSTVYLPVFFSQKMQSKDMSLHFNNIFNVWTAKRHSHIYVNQTRTKEQHMLYSKADNRIQDTIPLRLYTYVETKCSIVRLITGFRTQFHSDFTQMWETKCSIVRLITRFRTQFHSDFTQKWETESEEKWGSKTKSMANSLTEERKQYCLMSWLHYLCLF